MRFIPVVAVVDVGRDGVGGGGFVGRDGVGGGGFVGGPDGVGGGGFVVG